MSIGQNNRLSLYKLDYTSDTLKSRTKRKQFYPNWAKPLAIQPTSATTVQVLAVELYLGNPRVILLTVNFQAGTYFYEGQKTRYMFDN